MKLTKQLSLFTLSIIVLFSSCTMEKRHYQSGYYIDWKQKSEASAKVKNNRAIQEKINAIAVKQADVNVAIETRTSEPVLNNSITSTNSFSASTGNEIVLSEKNSNSSKVNTTVKAKDVFTAIKVAKKIAKEEKKQNQVKGTKATKGSGGKSQLVALLLCIFLGGIGIHRFYLGYTTIGIIQILTLGGCGVWALIDLVRIIIGDLGPKDGSYDKTL